MGNGWSSQDNTLIVITDITGYSGLFFYSPTIGPGNLVGSWTAAAGTDPYGNPYPAGFNVQSGPSHIEIQSFSFGLVTQTFITGNPAVSTSSEIFAEAGGIPGDEFDEFTLISAQNSTFTDFVRLTMASNTTTGSRDGAIFEVSYSGGDVTLTANFTGVNISAGSITAVNPTTGTSYANPAVAETWHTPTLAAGWTVTGASNPVRYRAEPQGCIRIDGEVLTTGAGPWPANNTVFSLPSVYMPSENHPFITRSDIAVAAGQCTVNVLSSGGVQNGQAFTAAGQRLWFDGVVFPLT